MLNVNVQGNVEITNAIHEHILAEADHLEKYSTDKVLELDVHVKKEHKTQYTVTIVGNGKSSTANAADLYKAITDSFGKMDKVLGKDKSVKISRRNNPVHPVEIDLTEDEE